MFKLETKNTEQGFTLVELLVVAVLLSLLASILYGTITGIIRGRSLVKGQLETVRVGQYIVEKIGRELGSALNVPVDDGSGNIQPEQDSSAAVESPTQTPNPISNNPYAGGAFGNNSRQPSFLSKNAKGDSSDRDSIAFVTAQSSQLLKGLHSNFGTIQVAYELRKDFKNIEDDDREPLSRDKSYSLVRTELPAGGNLNQKLKEFRTYEYSLADNVTGLNFRYYSKGRWLETWQGQGSNMPEAVEISLSLEDSEGLERQFRTSFSVGGS